MLTDWGAELQKIHETIAHQLNCELKSNGTNFNDEPKKNKQQKHDDMNWCDEFPYFIHSSMISL